MKTPPETFERLHKVFSAAHPASVLYFADRSVCSTVEILDLLDDLEDAITERDQLRAEVEALRRKPAPPTDEQPIPPLSVVRALSAPAYEDVLTDEERAACATIAAEVDALREVERLVRYAALARLDALRKEGT